MAKRILFTFSFTSKVIDRKELIMAKYGKVCECGISISTKKEKELNKLIKKHVAKSHVVKKTKEDKLVKIAKSKIENKE